MRFVASVVIRPDGDGVERVKKGAKEISGSLDEVVKKSKEVGSGAVEMAGIFGPKAKELAESIQGAATKVAAFGNEIVKLGAIAAPIVLVLAALFGVLGAGVAGGEFLKDVVQEGMKTEAVIGQLNRSLIANGAAAGYSAKELVEHAEALSRVTGVSKDVIVQGETVLTRFQNLGHEVFPQATKAALDLARATGKGQVEAFTLVGKALSDPSKGLRALTEIGIIFTKGQKETLAEMIKTGDAAGYQGIILKALAEHTGNAAGASSTLARGIAIAKIEIGLFKETIASEVLPAFAFLFNDLVKQLGGWDAIHDKVQVVAHAVGNYVREMVYGISLSYHSWMVDQLETLSRIEKGFGDFLFFLAKVALAMGDVPSLLGGGRSAWDPVAQGLARASASMTQTAAASHVAAVAQANDYLAAGAALVKHKLALEGDDEVQKKHSSVLDDVAEKEKRGRDLIAAADKAVREYAQHLAALNQKIEDEEKDNERLHAALGVGIEAYNATKDAIQAERESRAVAAELTKAHEAVIEKLTAAYGANSEQVLRSDAVFAEQRSSLIATSEAARSLGVWVKNIADEIVRIDKDATARMQTNADEFVKTMTEGWKRILAFKEGEKKTLQDLSDWQAQDSAVVQLGEHVASILKEYGLLSPALRTATVDALALGFAMRDGRLLIVQSDRDLAESEQSRLDSLHAYGAGLKLASDNAKSLRDEWIQVGQAMESDVLGALAKIATGTQVSLSDIIHQWEEMWVKAMLQWLADWAKTMLEAKALQSAANLGKADSASGGFGSLFGSSTQLDSASGSSGGIGSVFGGTSLGGGTAGSFAAIGAWAGVFAAVYLAGVQWLRSSQGHYAEATLGWVRESKLAVNNIKGNADRLPQVTNALQSAADEAIKFIEGLGGAIDSMTAQISLARKGQGSHTDWRVIVNGVVTHFAGDLNAAQQFAAVEVLKNATYSGLSPEVVAAIHSSVAKTLDAFQADIATALQAVHDRLGAAGSAYYDTSSKYTAQINAEQALGLATDATIAARERELKAIKDSAIGLDMAAANSLRDMVSLNAGMQEAGANMAATIQASLQAAQDELAALLARSTHTGGVGAGSDPNGTGAIFSNDISAAMQAQIDKLNTQIQSYIDQLGKIPQGLSDAEKNMGIESVLLPFLKNNHKYDALSLELAREKVKLQFDEIKLQLLALGKWEEFAGLFTDAYNAALADAGKKPNAGHGAGGTRQQDHQTALDNLDALRAQTTGAAAQTLLQFTQGVRSFDEAAKKGKLSAAQIAEGEHLLAVQRDRALQDQVTGGMQTLTGFTDPIVAINKTVADTRASIEALGATGKLTGQQVADAEAKLAAAGEYAKKRAAETLQSSIDSFGGGTNPFLAISMQAEDLSTQVRKFGEAAGWTADAIAGKLGEVQAAADRAKQVAVNGILDRLFEPLKDLPEYQGQIVQLKKEEVDLEYQILKAQLIGAGIWEENADLWQRSHDAALAAAGKIADVAETVVSGAGTAADTLSTASNTFKDAVTQFNSATDALRSSFDRIYGSTTLGGSAQDVLAFQQGQFRGTEAGALAGDVNARAAFGQRAEDYLAALNNANAGGALFASERARIYQEFQTLFAQTGFSLNGVGYDSRLGAPIAPTVPANGYAPSGAGFPTPAPTPTTNIFPFTPLTNIIPFGPANPAPAPPPRPTPIYLPELAAMSSTSNSNDREMIDAIRENTAAVDRFRSESVPTTKQTADNTRQNSQDDAALIAEIERLMALLRQRAA
jgi:hypothetical protein